ncbi:MAG: Maf family protein [Candidatus Veblenbacteria bacterium]|nr:Maf family protein [Candidatus Veblenbacteria bacterium]
MDIILGTSSKLRFRVMESLGIPFRVVHSNFNEEETKAEDVKDLVVATAKGKAAVLAPQYPDAVVITADSNSFFEGKKYGKPASREQAREWLLAMAGKPIDFYTALVVTHHTLGRQTVDLNHSRFIFKKYSEDLVERYLSQVDPTAMSIGWGPEGLGQEFLERFEGESGAERALPLDTLTRRLREFGIKVS